MHLRGTLNLHLYWIGPNLELSKPHGHADEEKGKKPHVILYALKTLGSDGGLLHFEAGTPLP